MSKHLQRTRIRRLKPGDALPAGEPARYRSAQGYIRLRWKIGVYQYVETYEHRLVAGLPVGQVHHRNHQKSDNGADNLKPVSSLEHGAEHSRADFAEAASLYAAGWSLPRLSRKYGVGEVSLMRSLKRRGVAIRSRSEAARLRYAS